MSGARAIGAAAATALAVLALRALDRAEEARAVLSVGAREASALARDPDLAPAAKAWNMPQEGNSADRP
jgi:hypothetical protein